MTDEEHAHAIREAVGVLNMLVDAAAKDGLKVELETCGRYEVCRPFPAPCVVPYISRVQTL